MAFLVLSTFLLAGLISTIPITRKNTSNLPDASLLNLSQEFLYRIKIGDSTTTLEFSLASIEKEMLIDGLNNDEAKKTFWINMYNAWFQVLAVREKMKNSEIFTAKSIIIAGTKFSLDDIEHGILRKYRWKYSMGYLPAFFPGRLIKQLAVSKIDYRIHFAMNCGAKSCPPISFYTYDKIDQQLNIATKSFLSAETEINIESKQVRVTKIMDWFKGDFGGNKGIQQIIKDVLGKDVDGYNISFKPYNWEEALHNFNE